jgi:hypothetical protein
MPLLWAKSPWGHWVLGIGFSHYQLPITHYRPQRIAENRYISCFLLTWLLRKTLNFYKNCNLYSPTPKDYDILYNNFLEMVDVSIL